MRGRRPQIPVARRITLLRAKLPWEGWGRVTATIVALLVMVGVSLGAEPPDEKSKSAAFQPTEVTTKEKIAAFDPKTPAQVLGAFDPGTKLMVIDATQDGKMYHVKFTDPSGSVIEALCTAEVIESLLERNPKSIIGNQKPAASTNRALDFEIAVQPLQKESSNGVQTGSTWTAQKDKSQNLAYKISFKYKGADKLEGVVLSYVVGCKIQGRSKKLSPIEYFTDEKKYDEIAFLDKFELTTKPIESTYTETTAKWDGGVDRSGKKQLLGIAIKISQGDKVLAEFANSPSSKDFWEAKGN